MKLSFTQSRQIHESLAILPLKIDAIIPAARAMVALKQELQAEDDARKKLIQALVGAEATQILDTHPRFLEWVQGSIKIRETESEVKLDLSIALSDIELNRAPVGIQEHIARLASFGFVDLKGQVEK